MAISFDKAFGIHQQALVIRAERAKVLAENLANADTPNFKARDIDFSRALLQAQSRTQTQSIANVGLHKTHPMHLDSQTGDLTAGIAYRVPMQPDTGDGNTVDAQLEQAKFTENAMQYQTTLRFLDSKVKGLLRVIKGE